MSLLTKKQARQYDNASTQINVPDDVAAEITRIGQELIPDEHLAGDGRVEVIHITVKYGVQPDENLLRKAMAGRKSFPVTLGKTMVFPEASTEGTPVVIQVHGHGFDELHKAVAAAMGILPDDFPYTPHITVAYVTQVEAQHYAGRDEFAGIEFVADAVTLSMFDDDNQVDVPLKTAASPAQVTPEIPQVRPQTPQQQEPEEDEEVQRDEPATPEQKQEQPKPKRPQQKLLQPKQPKTKSYKAPKPPAKNPDFKKWFGKSQVRDENGKPLVVYHGTTHDFQVFDPSKGNVEAYYGRALYFTSDQEDVGSNYATESGPDITSRIERRYEQLQNEIYDLEGEELEEVLGEKVDENEDIDALLKEKAKKDIAGQTKGLSMPVYLSIQNPVYVQKKGGTHFSIEFDEETEQESGNGVDLWNALQLVAGNFEDADWQQVWEGISGDMEFTAWDFEQQVRNTGGFQDPNTGDMASGEFISQVYQELGFDGIVLDAYGSTFFGPGGGGKMNMEYGTKHYIIWDPTKVKSAIGNVGKYDPRNPSITAAAVPFKFYPITDEWIAKATEFLKEKWAQRHTEMQREGVPTDLKGACKFASIFAQKVFGGQIKGNPDHQVVKTPHRIIDLTGEFDPNTFRHDKEWFGNPEHEESMQSCMPRVNQWYEEFKQKYPPESITSVTAADWDDEEFNDEPQEWEQFTTLQAGTTLYHGTSNEWEEGSELSFPAWFSTNKNVADWFAHRNDEGTPMIRMYRVNSPIKLVELGDKNDMQQFFEMYGIEDYGIETISEGTINAGFEGWYIPDNYRPGDDIMLGDGSKLEYMETHPASKKANRFISGVDPRIAAGATGVGDLGLAKRIMHELMPVLGEQLPEPELKIVNQPRAGHLGQDIWTVGTKDNTIYGAENTRIELQKWILEDEKTLRRILAHELCHHADNLVNGPKLIEKYQSTWGGGKAGYTKFFTELHREGHGQGWKAYAQKYNSKYGADFVTEKSDETYKKDEQPLKPFYIRLYKHPSGKIYYATSALLHPKLVKYLWGKKHEPDESERMTKTDDRRFLRAAPIGRGWSIPKAGDLEMAAKLEELWNQAANEPLPELPNPWVKKREYLIDPEFHKKMLEREGKEVIVKPTEKANYYDVDYRWKTAAAPQLEDLEQAYNDQRSTSLPQIDKLEHGVSKDYDRVRWVYQQFYDNQIRSMSWKDFQKKFPWAQNSPLFTKVRQNRPQITLEDLDRWMEEYNTKAKEYQNYELEHDTYRDKDTSFRDVEQLVLRVNQSASAAEIIGEDEMLRGFLEQVQMGSQRSGHPVSKNTVGWLRVDFINDQWLLIDEVQSDLINAVDLAKRFIAEPSLASLMQGYKSETVKQKIQEMGATEAMFQNSKREFARRGYTPEKLEEMKQSLANLFKDWAEYGIASIIEIARRHGIKNIAIHTGGTIAQRDPDVEADKVGMYYDQIAKAFGFKKQQLDIGELKGEFWTRTASTKSNLKAWFDGSKVVDEKGNPRVVYHGSRSAWLTQFDLGREGTGVHGATKWGAIWFTSSAENAEEYADPKEEKVEADLDEIVPYGNDPFYAAVYDINGESLFQVGPHPTEEEAEREGLAQAKLYNQNLDKNTNVIGVYLKITNPYITDKVPRDAEFKAAKQGGHDGIIAYDVVDGYTTSDVFVIFNPSQAKSADRNVGTYDPKNVSLTAGKRSEAVTSMTVGTNDPNFPSPVLIRWEQGMRWREVLKVVKSIVGEVAGSRVPWRDIHIWASLWENQQTQNDGWTEERAKGTHVMYDILHNGSFVSVGKPTAAPLGEEVIEASHKETPLSDTMFNEPELGTETNAYADMPEKVRGDEAVPSLEELAPQMFEKEGASDLLLTLKRVRPNIVRRAQQVYDAWEPSGIYGTAEGGDVEFGEGGICDMIAEEINDLLASLGIDTTAGGHDGDEHAWSIAYNEKEAYGVDIPHQLYERGGGYSWKKIPGVTFSIEDVQIFPIDVDPSEFAKEGARGEALEGVEYRIEVMDSHGGELFCQAEAWLNDERIGVVYFNESEEDVELDNTEYYREGQDEYGGKEWERIKELPKKIWVKNVEVKPKYRRQGIATGMYEKIKKEFPGEEITSSGTTPDGTPFRKKLTERGVLAYKSALLKSGGTKEQDEEADRLYHESVANEGKGPENRGVYNGKRFWSGIADAADGSIIEIHTYEEADRAGFHHSFYVSPESQEMMRDGVYVFFWVDKNGRVNTEHTNKFDTPAGLEGRIRSYIDVPRTASLLKKKAEYAEQQSQVQHTDHTAIGLTKTLKSNPFHDELQVLNESLGKDQPVPNPALDAGRVEGQPTAKGEDKVTQTRTGAEHDEDFSMMGKVGPFYRIDTMRYSDVAAFHGKRFADKVRNGQKVTVYRAGKPGETLKPGTFLSASKNMALSYQHEGTESFGGPELYRYEVDPKDLLHVENFEASELVWKPRTKKAAEIAEQVSQVPARQPWEYKRDEYAPRPKIVKDEKGQDIYEEETDEQARERYRRSREWEQDSLGAMSLGKMTPEQAKERGYWTDVDKPSSFKPLPAKLYHVTTNASAVYSQGLKTRHELAMDRGGTGLGGGTDKAISFTTDLSTASGIYRAIIEGIRVLNGKITIQRLIEMAEKGEGADRPWINELINWGGAHFVSYSENDPNRWTLGKPYPPHTQAFFEGKKIVSPPNMGTPDEDMPDAEPIGYGWTGGDGKQRHTQYKVKLTPEELQETTFDFFKTWLTARENAGGHLNPLFFSSNVQALAATPEDEVAILEFKPVPGALGTQESALGEWRVYTGKAVQLVGTVPPNVKIATKTAGLRGTLEYHRTEDVLWIDMFALNPKDRGQGGGRIAWKEFESSIPQDITKICLFAGDTGGGPSAGFWEKMGFSYMYDQESGTEYDQYMWKGANGHPTPKPLDTPDEEHGYDIHTGAASNIVSGEDVVSYVQKLNKWDRQTAYQVVGLDAGGDYILTPEYDLDKLEAGDDYDPEAAERYAKMKTPFPPIVLNIEGKIRDGNHRVAAAKLRGDKTIAAYEPLDTYDPSEKTGALYAPAWIKPNLTEEQGEITRSAPQLGVTPEALTQALNKGQLTSLEDSLWSKLENTDSWETVTPELAKQRAGAYSRDIDRIYNGLKAKKSQMPAAIVVMKKDGTPYLLAGNTRLMAARSIKIRPAVWLGKL